MQLIYGLTNNTRSSLEPSSKELFLKKVNTEAGIFHKFVVG